MTEQILHEKNASILLIEQRENDEVVIGAPHHTLGGVKNMPCPEHTSGDENTGFVARQLAEQIKSSSVIACNYRVDPNKSLNTDYSTQIAKWEPKFLIEIHGHGAKKIDNFCIFAWVHCKLSFKLVIYILLIMTREELHKLIDSEYDKLESMPLGHT
ncbi:hypothetical protein P1X15_20545, partial [Runella sp. MFBS21]|uniref:hypothetical protein n=1 Tax=Runella sp. MFBS21 TaxID=3034018 RepID=UPI0023F91533